MTKPFGLWINTSSVSTPLRKALFTSSWYIGQWFMNARLNTICTIEGLTTGLKLSKKSTLSVLWNPFTTNLALYFEALPSELCLTWNIHLLPTILVVDSVGTKVQELFLSRAWNSSFIAWCHLRSTKAALTLMGSRS